MNRNYVNINGKIVEENAYGPTSIEYLIEEMWRYRFENDRLRDALEWYAKEERYESDVDPSHSKWFKPFVTPGIVYDKGKKAREALEDEDN